MGQQSRQGQHHVRAYEHTGGVYRRSAQSEVRRRQHAYCLVTFLSLLTHHVYARTSQAFAMTPRLPPPDFNEGAAQVRRLLDRDRRELMGEEEIGQVLGSPLRSISLILRTRKLCRSDANSISTIMQILACVLTNGAILCSR